LSLIMLQKKNRMQSFKSVNIFDMIMVVRLNSFKDRWVEGRNGQVTMRQSVTHLNAI